MDFSITFGWLRWLGAVAGTWLVLVGMSAPIEASFYELPDQELINSEFVVLWGSSTLDQKTDLSGPRVQFTLTLPNSGDGKTGIGDNWPVNAAAGLAWDPGLGHYTSLAAYDGYQMVVQYLSGSAGSDIDVHLYMNTGLTGPSGYPSNDTTNDTFWAGAWVNVPLGQTVVLTLDFDSAEAWNISDNKSPHTGGGLDWADGGWYAINDRDRNEVSNIGFEFADFDGDALDHQIQLNLNVIPEPAGICLLASACAMAAAWWWLRRL